MRVFSLPLLIPGPALLVGNQPPFLRQHLGQRELIPAIRAADECGGAIAGVRPGDFNPVQLRQIRQPAVRAEQFNHQFRRATPRLTYW